MRKETLFSSNQLASLLNALPDPAFILTRSGRYRAIHGGVDTRFYHDSSPLIGKTIHEVMAPDRAAWFQREIETALRGRAMHIVEYSLTPGDIQGLAINGLSCRLWFEGRIQALDFAVDGEDAVLWVASNITARKELEVQLRRLSEVDALSGLLNRRKLMHLLAEHFDTFERYATPMAMLIFDIDHFKRVNDAHGHLAGDIVIKTTADVCRRELRNTDAPARLGGDEFVVLMPHTSGEQAAPIAERLRQRIAESLHALGAVGEGATISGGLAEFGAADASCEDVLQRGDDALYRAKRSGRNRIVSID
ncbi:GGDEF domain-containing protein [Pseudoduganella violaceinigra]|uniref:GGDEF domain-containing protein n=1 Tax=Pseudoduganella violaceinigra TaxID=246602 RepID=UPI000416AB14|nr:sensor domain-containing diguanylate cyclase [Pseudoduganella violaceinigra]